MADVTRVLCSCSAPVDALWRAISEPALLARWLGSCPDLRMEEGVSFSLQLPARPWFDGRIAAQVRHVDVGRTWQMSWSNPALDGETLARLSAIATPGGSRLEVTHSGFAGGSLAMKALHIAGWNKVARLDLKKVLASM